MMEGYMAVLTKGMCQSDENGSFLIKDYHAQKAYLAGSIKGTPRGGNSDSLLYFNAKVPKRFEPKSFFCDPTSITM